MNQKEKRDSASVDAIVMRFVEQPYPTTGPVKIIRENLPLRVARFKIVQSGGSFRLHGNKATLTLSPDDASWIIDHYRLIANASPIFRRVITWQD